MSKTWKSRVIIGFGLVMLAAMAAWPASARSKAELLKGRALLAHSAPESVSMGPSSAFIEVAIDDVTGQFTMGEPNGGPILLYGHPNPWSTFTTIRVDGTDYVNRNSPGGESVTWGAQVQPPTTTGNTSEGIWQVGTTPIQVHQIITLVTGSSTGNPDTYLIQYKLVNTDTAAHIVGCRIMFDTDLDNNDGAPFQVPGTGSVTLEQEWAGAVVPPYFFVFNDLTTPSVTTEGSLTSGAVNPLPDKFQIAAWPNVYSTSFDYTVDPSATITNDSAYNVFWMSHDLAGGSNVTFGTYYGLGGINVDNQPPLVTALTAPEALECVNSLYTPNPFTISLYVSNTTPGVAVTVTGITATLALPPGLVLASGTLAQSIPDEAPGDSKLVSWQVRADGSATGPLSYSIQLNSANAGNKTLTKSVTVPVGCLTNCPSITIVSVNGSTCPNPLVLVNVLEASGSPITGLTSAAFCLSENGVSKTVTATPGAVAGQYVLAFTTSDTSTTAKTLDVCVTAEECTVHAQGRYNCTCVLTCGATVPAKAVVNTSVAFAGTVTATECGQAPTFSWSFGDGSASVSGQNVSHTYTAAGTYSWTMTATANGVACTASGRITIVLPPNVTLIKKVAPPFKFVVTGSNLQNGIRVFINNTEWTSVIWKNTGKIQLTGGANLKLAVPKNQARTFRFLNPDGGEVSQTWSW